MADKRGTKVESFKLTPEQKKFQKDFKRLRSIQSLLEGATLVNSERTKRLQELWNELNAEFEALKFNIPKESVFELQGMNFEEDEAKERTSPESWNIEY